jgi:hypothetical protein
MCIGNEDTNGNENPAADAVNQASVNEFARQLDELAKQIEAYAAAKQSEQGTPDGPGVEARDESDGADDAGEQGTPDASQPFDHVKAYRQADPKRRVVVEHGRSAIRSVDGLDVTLKAHSKSPGYESKASLTLYFSSQYHPVSGDEVDRYLASIRFTSFKINKRKGASTEVIRRWSFTNPTIITATDKGRIFEGGRTISDYVANDQQVHLSRLFDGKAIAVAVSLIRDDKVLQQFLTQYLPPEFELPNQG